jgi:hypothetical protein
MLVDREVEWMWVESVVISYYVGNRTLPVKNDGKKSYLENHIFVEKCNKAVYAD